MYKIKGAGCGCKFLHLYILQNLDSIYEFTDNVDYIIIGQQRQTEETMTSKLIQCKLAYMYIQKIFCNIHVNWGNCKRRKRKLETEFGNWKWSSVL